MEENKRELMSEEEFKAHISKIVFNPMTFIGNSKFKSMGRAYRRGHIHYDGTLYPRKPYNNRKNTSSRRGVCSRVLNEEKRKIYGYIKNRTNYKAL